MGLKVWRLEDLIFMCLVMMHSMVAKIGGNEIWGEGALLQTSRSTSNHHVEHLNAIISLTLETPVAYSHP
jgi:hypothetical protein